MTFGQTLQIRLLPFGQPFTPTIFPQSHIETNRNRLRPNDPSDKLISDFGSSAERLIGPNIVCLDLLFAGRFPVHVALWRMKFCGHDADWRELRR